MRFALMLIFMEISYMRVTLGGEAYSESLQGLFFVVTLAFLVMDVLDFLLGKD